MKLKINLINFHINIIIFSKFYKINPGEELKVFRQL